MALNLRILSSSRCNRKSLAISALDGSRPYQLYLGMPKLWARNLVVLMQPLALLVSALAMRVPALAQGETTSAIVGSVTDPTGAAIPGATVTVTSSRERPETIRENGRLRAL